MNHFSADEDEPSQGNHPREYQLDRESWTAVFEQIRPGLRAFLAAKLPQDVDVEDCVQSVFVAMLQNRKDVPPAARRAWLFRVAANQAAHWWRDKAAGERVLEKHRHAIPACDLPDGVSGMETEETLQRVVRALDQLPPNTKTIIQMRVHQGLTFQVIADQLEIPLGTVLTRMRRGLDQLRALLSDEI